MLLPGVQRRLIGTSFGKWEQAPSTKGGTLLEGKELQIPFKFHHNTDISLRR